MALTSFKSLIALANFERKFVHGLIDEEFLQFSFANSAPYTD